MIRVIRGPLALENADLNRFLPQVALPFVLLLAAIAPAAEPSPGDAMLADYFKSETAKLQQACLADIDSLDEWQAKRPELHRQLAEMLGLDPMPERTPLNAKITETTETDDIIIERLFFESRPGLYVTANFYRPKEQAGPLPAVLYVCGHAVVKKGGVSFGNKAGYHHHGAWFARNGYVCLTIDTLQLGEIEGIHHGTHREGRWWWNSRGYTPAGVEAWNSIRAIDYLQSRPEADGDKIGITGRSGGGAYSWYTAAMDDRITVAVPVAGITDLQNHVVDDCVEGHCDCMFMVNTYRWDYPLLAALIAPRPLLISNTDKDKIFPLDGVVRTHALVRKIYELYDAEDKLGLHITEGPHKDTQELRIHAFVWLDRYLRGENRVITDPAEKFLEPEQLKVFASLPNDEVNTKIDETFVPKADEPSVPESASNWESMRQSWLTELRELTFAGWPKEKSPLDLKSVRKQEDGDLVVREYEFTSQGAFRLPLIIVGTPQSLKQDRVELHVLSDEEWQSLQRVLGTDPSAPGLNALPFVKGLLQDGGPNARTLAFVAPRCVGPTRWTDDAKERIHIRRRFMLLGQTLAGMQVYDVLRAIDAIEELEPDAEVRLIGTGDSAVIALYSALFADKVARLELIDLPASHREGPDFLNVLRILELPQAVALAAERGPVQISTPNTDAWMYSREVVESLGWKEDRLEIVEGEPTKEK